MPSAFNRERRRCNICSPFREIRSSALNLRLEAEGWKTTCLSRVFLVCETGFQRWRMCKNEKIYSVLKRDLESDYRRSGKGREVDLKLGRGELDRETNLIIKSTKLRQRCKFTNRFEHQVTQCVYHNECLFLFSIYYLAKNAEVVL